MHFHLLRLAGGMLAMGLCLLLSSCSKTESSPGEGLPTGSLDSADSKLIQGWAWDPQRPDVAIEVRRYHSGLTIDGIAPLS